MATQYFRQQNSRWLCVEDYSAAIGRSSASCKCEITADYCLQMAYHFALEDSQHIRYPSSVYGIKPGHIEVAFF